ncbi:MAG: hypothetical protein BGO69_01385 [Bacteroidetes bacterium 46-16]|nr:MAG: hypothetical protein BGO69_01385 [Bacteroidetes bacterium 46-16]
MLLSPPRRNFAQQQPFCPAKACSKFFEIRPGKGASVYLWAHLVNDNNAAPARICIPLPPIQK